MPTVRYYLIKEVNGVIVRKTEIVHDEPRDAKGRYRSPEQNWNSRVKSAAKARPCRCPRCGYEFLVG